MKPNKPNTSLPAATTTVTIPGEDSGSITMELSNQTPDMLKITVSNSFALPGGKEFSEASVVISKHAFDILFRAVSSYGQHYKPNASR